MKNNGKTEKGVDGCIPSVYDTRQRVYISIPNGDKMLELLVLK